jgi:hypothetical protein
MSSCVSRSAAFRAVVGGAVYLALLAVFSLSVGAILRHTAGAITLVLAVLLTPVIATNFLPEHLGHRSSRAPCSEVAWPCSRLSSAATRSRSTLGRPGGGRCVRSSLIPRRARADP